MGRSFGIVEQKLEEADFFLEKLEETIQLAPFDFEPQYYLSAFASATRSITFTIQASISDIDNFNKWYSTQQEKLREDKLARYFLEARNLSQKIGYYLIGSASSYKDENGETQYCHFFQTFNSDQLEYVPEEDVLTCCKKYFETLLEVIIDCYKTFGYQIDPELFFTKENFEKTGKTIEDFEEQAGYPRDWTGNMGLTIEQRIELIRNHHPKPKIDWVFEKYLGTNRFGEKIEDQ